MTPKRNTKQMLLDEAGSLQDVVGGTDSQGKEDVIELNGWSRNLVNTAPKRSQRGRQKENCNYSITHGGVVGDHQQK